MTRSVNQGAVLVATAGEGQVLGNKALTRHDRGLSFIIWRIDKKNLLVQFFRCHSQDSEHRIPDSEGSGSNLRQGLTSFPMVPFFRAASVYKRCKINV